MAKVRLTLVRPLGTAMTISHQHRVLLATCGVLLPFVVDALLIVALRRQIGVSNYPSESFTRATDWIITPAWIAVAIVPFTLLPLAWSVAARRSSSWIAHCLAVLLCVGTAVILTPLFVLFHAVVYTFAGGVK